MRAHLLAEEEYEKHLIEKMEGCQEIGQSFFPWGYEEPCGKVEI